MPKNASHIRFVTRYKKLISHITLTVYLFSPNIILAQGIIAATDQHAPVVDTTANGVPVVNINKATAGGVSRNNYQDFNVGNEGVILNNSPDIINTQLSGYIDGNTRLEGNQASIILNEVMGGNASILNGYTEVAGQAAEVVIANQNGITCNGCGFINTPRTTLTTGQLLFESNQFNGFDVSQGTIQIGEDGFNVSNIDQVDILAQSIDINGKIWADYLNVVTGNNVISSDLSIIVTQTSDAEAPEFALDVSALGGMYANSIRLIGTENGLGVNLKGDVIAASDLFIDQKGLVSNSATIASNALEISATGLTNTKQGNILSVEKDADITISDTLKNEGSIKGKGLTLNTGKLENLGQSAVIVSEKNLTIESNEILNSDLALILAKGDLDVTSNGSIKNNNASIKSVGTLSLDSTSLENSGTTASIQSKGKLTLGVNGNVTNQDGATLSSFDEMVLSIIGSLNNTASSIQSVLSLTLDSGDFNNSANATFESLTSGLEMDVQTANNSGLISGDTLSINALSFHNKGESAQVQSGDSLILSTSTGDIKNTDGSVIFGQNSVQLNSTTDIVNQQSSIQSLGSIDAKGVNIKNETGATIIAKTDTLTLEADTTISNSGVIVGKGVTLNTLTLSNTGENAQIQSAADLDIKASRVTNDAVLFSAQNINIAATDKIENTDIIQANNSINIKGGVTDNSQGRLQSKNSDVTLDVKALNNTGVIAGQNVTIASEELSNAGSTAQIQAKKALDIDVTVGDLSNSDGGVLYSIENMVLNVFGSIKNTGATIKSILGLNVDAESLNNNANASLIADGDVQINVSEYDNQGLIQGTNVDVTTDKFNHNGDSAQLQANNNLVLTVTHQNLTNQGVIYAGENLTLNSVNNQIINKDIIEAGKNITLNTTAIHNTQVATVLSTKGNISADVNSIVNQGTLAAQDVTLASQTFKNAGSDALIQANDTLNISVTKGDLNNESGATLFGFNAIQLSASNAINNIGSYIQSAYDTAMSAISFNNDEDATLLLQNGTLDVQVDDLNNKGAVVAKDINLTSGSFTNAGESAQIQAANDLTIAVSESDISNTSGAVLYAGNDLTLTSVSDTHDIVNNNAVIQAGNQATLNAKSFTNNNGGAIATQAGELSVDVTNFSNTALIAGHSVIIDSNTFVNSGQTAQIQANSSLSVTSVGDITNQLGALLYSKDSATLSTQGTLDNQSSSIKALGGIDIVSAQFINSLNAIIASQYGALSVTNSNNSSNQGILAGNQVSIASDGFINSGEHALVQATSQLNIQSDSYVNNQSSALIYSQGNADIRAVSALNNTSSIIEAGQNLDITASSINNKKGTEIGQDPGYIVSSGDMAITGALDNQSSIIHTQGDFFQSNGAFYNDKNATFKAMSGTASFVSLNWYNYGFIGADNLNVTASSILNSGDDALVLALDHLSMKTTSYGLGNLGGAVLYSVNTADFDVKDTLLNGASLIETGGSLNIKANKVMNKREGFVLDYETVQTDKVVGEEINRTDLPNPPSSGNFWYANISYVENTNTPNVVEEGVQGAILSGSELTLETSQGVLNDISTISSAGNLIIKGGAIENIDRSANVTVTQTGTYKWGTWSDCSWYETCSNKNRKNHSEDFTSTKTIQKTLASSIISSNGNITGSELESLVNGADNIAAPSSTIDETNTKLDETSLQKTDDIALKVDTVELTEIDKTELTEDTQTIETIDDEVITVVEETLKPIDSNELTTDFSDANLDDLSSGALFSQTDNPDHGYLIETNPNFTDYQNFISSDYMLERLGIDINEGENTRLGDGYFEQDIVRDQILDLSGTQYLDGNQNVQDQYLDLMNNGIDAQDDLSLTVGVALTAEQIQMLDKPIVWLVEQEFETENGTQTALVPQVYFTNVMQMLLREDGALIAGTNVNLGVENTLANSGTIKAKERLQLTANDIESTGKLSAIEKIDLIAQRDIINQSGSIEGGKININAGRDFINETKVELIDLEHGNFTGTQSQVGDMATVNGKDVIIFAGNDVKLIGSNVTAENDLGIQAFNDIEITTAKIIEDAMTGNYNVSSEEHITSEIGAGTVLMLAGETLKSEGANIHADDDIDIIAKDIQLLAVKNRQDQDVYHNYGGGDTEHRQSHTEVVIGTQLNTTGVLRLSSETDILSKGSTLTGAQGLALDAGGDILLATEMTLNTNQVDKTSKSSGIAGSTKRASTSISDSLQHTGTSLTSDGNIIVSSGGDVVLVGSLLDAGQSIGIDAVGDLLVTAAINENFDSYSKTKKDSFTQSAKSTGSNTQEALASGLNAGGNMSITSGGNIAIEGSNLSAGETLMIGNATLAKDENGDALTNDQGQYVNTNGEQVGNVTVTSVELKNESWHEESSGLRGPLKDLAKGITAVAGLHGIDMEIEVGRSTSEHTSETLQRGSKIQADNLGIDVKGDVAIVGSSVNVDNIAQIKANSLTLDAAQETNQTSLSETVETVSSSGPRMGENEVSVVSLENTDTTTTTTTTATSWKGSTLNAGTLSVETTEEVALISSDISVAGDTQIHAKDIVLGGRQDTTTTTTEHKEVIETVTVGVKNAYVDTAQAIKDLNDAKNDVLDAKQAYDDAKQKIANGQMPASELKYFETNIAAATVNVANATIAVASSGATAAATTGTGGFYATGSASVETNESSSTTTDNTWNGSTLNVGGNATLQAQDEIQIKGSNVAVAGGLQMDAKDINLLAGENGTQTSSESSSHTESASYSTASGPSGSLSAQESESTSESTYYTNTQIVAGTLSSDSENLTLSGANVDAGVIDITTDTLLVESLQNTSTSNSKSQGANVGIGGNGAPTSGGVNYQQSESSSAWVDQQSGITGGDVTIKAKDTTLKGGLIAAVDESGEDNGNLTFQTDTLTVEDIQDHSTSSDKGFSLNTGASSTTVGANYSGHDTEQTTKATIGNGDVTVAAEQIAEGTVNRDTNNSQEITKDHELGGLDINVTVDHRLASEEGRQEIANDFEDTAEHAQDIARTAETLYDNESLNILNFGEALHNNASATQLKNDLVRNPENAEILAGLQSDNPEEYAQAVEDLGHLAQDKFGLELSDIGLYNADETTSSSLGDNALVDTKGGTVVDQNNEQAGNIFIDVSQNDDGSDIAKTDTVNTLGHEVLETQDFQGKGSGLTGGLFGSNTGDQQESLANAFGDQFSDRINQATGDTLDSTGGDNFNQGLRNSDAVTSGTRQANTVGAADVEHRQLYRDEAQAILGNAQSYADKHNISLDKAKQELTQQALLQVDSEWAEQTHIQENSRAREALTEIAAQQTDKASDTLSRDPLNQLVRDNVSEYFEATKEDYNDTTKNAHEFSAIENGAAGEASFHEKYATENGEKPLEIGLGDAAEQIADNTVEGAKNLADRAIEDPVGLLKDTASGVVDTLVDCTTTMNCVLPDQTHGTASDRELVYELLNNGDEAKQAAAEDTLDSLASMVGPAGRAVKGTAGKLINVPNGSNGSFDAEGDFDGKNPSDSLAQEADLQAKKELIESKLPPASEVTGAYTLDKKDEDIALYENLKRADDTLEPEFKRNPKSAGGDAASRIIDGIGNVLKEMKDAQ